MSSREIPLSIHNEANGSVVIFEEGTVPFPVRRTFVVFAEAGQLRGGHAHRTCTQIEATPVLLTRVYAACAALWWNSNSYCSGVL